MNRYIIIALLITFGLSACEDEITLNVDPGPEQLVIDAVINDQSEDQVIRLTLSAPYFENVEAPRVSEAEVIITDQDGKEFVFTDNDNDGDFIWSPSAEGETIGTVDKNYILSVKFDGEEFVAASKVNRVPPIDSLTYEFREQEGIQPEGYYASFWAVDPLGPGDTYWIRTYRNDTLLNRPSDLNTAYDASFSLGANTDGLIFILPIREGINPFYQDDDNSVLSPFNLGDEIRVELLSVTNDVVFFLQQVQNQLQNGGLFATPLENISSNIQNTNPNSDVVALGYFVMCAESSLETTIIQQED